MTNDQACGCGGEHDDELICGDCGRFQFHFVVTRGPVVVAVVVACAYCDFLDEWPAVWADSEAFGAVERSLAAGSVLPSIVWDPAILN